MKKFVAVLVPLAIALLLAACGNKGPLVKPAPTAAADVPAETIGR